MIDLQVIDLKMPSTIILRRPFLRRVRAVESNHYLKLKFRAAKGIGIMKGAQKITRTCFAISSKRSYYITTRDAPTEDKEDIK